FDVQLESDTAALHDLVRAMLAATRDIHVLRDPTRGGLASTLNEIAQTSGVSIELEEEALPLQPEVEGLCEILGLDPLYVANEGKLIAIVPEQHAGAVLAAMRAHPQGSQARVIGRVQQRDAGLVQLRTCVGGYRVVDVPAGEQLPRIC
ncbi:MAG: AIR synthase-related protein, partial [Chloroflexota bacterium]